MDKLLEILAVPALLAVAVLVALEARWRHDPRHAGAARVIKWIIRMGSALLVFAIALFVLVLILVAPIGP
jgi:hypothetical protein